MDLRFWRTDHTLTAHQACEITLAKGVLDFVESQVLRARDELETGGLLLGTIGPGAQRLVLAASPPGPAALHHPVMFERDLEFSQYMLNEMHGRHKLEYLGEWHKHPRNYTEPSGGDEAGCRAILTDPSYKIAGLMLFPIFTLARDGGVNHHYYCMDSSLTYRVFSPVIEECDHFMHTVHELEQLYLTRSRRASVTDIERQGETDCRLDVAPKELLISPRWYESEAGKRDLSAAAMGLKDMGLDVDTRILADGKIAFVVRGPKHQELTVICETTHPQCAPIVHVAGAVSWDGSAPLADFIAEIHGFFSRGRTERLDILG